MIRTSRNQTMLQRSAVLLLSMVIPAFAWGQHNKTSAPAAPKSAPAHNSAPSHPAASHSAPPSHSSTASHAAPSRPASANRSTPATNRSATANRGNTASRPNTGTNRPGTTSRPNGNTNRPGAANNRSSAPNRANPGAARGATPAHATMGSHTPPGRNVSLRGGGTASVRPNGQIRSVDRNGMHIQNGLHGNRTVVSEHNGARIVTTGAHGGYVQRAYVTRGGVSFYSRTYVSGGFVHVGVYRGYYWGGHPYYGWTPGFYFHPGFYGWGYHPWGAPVYWGVGLWGWGGSPWWGFYGGWWNPYPYYAAPAYWLTDYLVAQSLQAAYAAHQEEQADAVADEAQASAAGGDGGGDGTVAATANVALTPEVKEAIAQEVKAQLAAQQAQADQASNSAAPAPAGQAAPANASAQAPPPALDPAQRTFVVDSDVTVVSNGQECALTAGDVVTRLTDTPDADQTVNASVSATKKGDCPSGQTVAVKVDDLQEMYNHFQENIQNGMSELAKKQGTNGMPAAPDTGTTASSVPPPPPDPNAAKTLQDQQAAANQTEAQARQDAASSGGTQ
jgi:hypothetical protein